MKGYRTPSWFRVKGLFRSDKLKAQAKKPQASKPKQMEKR